MDDFLKSEVMNLKGIHLVQRGKKYTIEYVTLKELLWAKADKHGVFGAYSETTLISNGKAWMGKTGFCNALAMEFTLRKSKTAYGWGTIDKYGAVTRAAQMHLLGCFVFDDFVLATRGVHTSSRWRRLSTCSTPSSVAPCMPSMGTRSFQKAF